MAIDRRGWFHRQAQGEDEELVSLGHYKQLQEIIIPANTTGAFGPVNFSGNGLHLVKRLSKSGGGSDAPSILTGSTTARVMVKFNRVDNPWVPFSFIANENDFQFFAGTISKIWFYVSTVDAANPILFLVTTNAGLSSVQGCGSSTSAYSVPAGAQGPIAASGAAAGAGGSFSGGSFSGGGGTGGKSGGGSGFHGFSPE